VQALLPFLFASFSLGWADPAEELGLEAVPSLEAQLMEAYGVGDIVGATAAAEEIVRIQRAELSPGHSEFAVSLNNLANLRQAAGDLDAARPLYEESVAIDLATLGPDDPDRANGLRNLASVHMGLGHLDIARSLYEESRELLRAAYGDDDSEVADCVSGLGRVEQAAGDLDGALALFEEALAIRRSALGDSHRNLAESHNNIATVWLELGDLDAARTSFDEALRILMSTVGDGHPHVALTLNNLAAVLRRQGDWATARERIDQAIQIWRSLDHPGLVDGLGTLGHIAEEEGDLEAARVAYSERLEIRRRTVGDSDSRVAESLSELGGIWLALGDNDRVRPLYEEALAIRRQVLGPDHPLVATSLNDLGVLRESAGDLVSARALYEESLERRRAAFGDHHEAVAGSLNNLAHLLQSLGDLDGASLLFEEALETWRSTVGPEHPYVATGLTNLGHLRVVQGDFGAGEALYRESLAIQRAARGPGHPAIATALNNLASLARQLGDLDTAESLNEESLALRRAALGDRHPDVAQSLSNLGIVRRAQGDTTAALELYEEANAIWRADRRGGHPRLIGGLSNLSGAQRELGEDDAARVSMREVMKLTRRRLDLLDGLTEREALRYLPTLTQMLDRWLAVFDRPEDAREAWANVLRFKGSVAAKQRSARALAFDELGLAETALMLRAKRAQVARLALADGGSGETAQRRREQLVALASEAEGLERILLDQSATYARRHETERATPERVCKALPAHTALVDVLRILEDDAARYVAFVVTNRRCEVHRVDLGLAADIDDAVAGWRDVLANPNSFPQRISDRGEALAALVWDPIAPSVGRARRVLLIPDGTLAAAPLGALPMSDGDYLLEHVDIGMLDRAQDLFLPMPRGEGSLVVGGVDFGGAVGEYEGVRGSAAAPCTRSDWSFLPGTVAEAERLGGRVEPATHLTGDQATEEAIQNGLPGKRVVHIATHGFFARDQGCISALDGSGGVGYDPMLMSGIVLAGANRPPEPLAVQDGILTAAEVAALDLSGTELVVLSACETGLGEIRSGQGVLGLRRAFAIAGTGSLVMTLWAVGDEQSAEIMERFYDQWLRGKLSPADALLRAQRSLIDEDAPAWGWAGVVATGVPDSRGRRPTR